MFTKSFFSTVLLISLAACGGGADDALAELETDAVRPTVPNVGMGVHQLTYWDRSFAMADVVRQAQFRSLTWGYDVAADATGAPGQDFYLVFSSHRIGAGTYKLLFNGRADVTLSASAGGSVQNLRYDPATNRSTADVVLAADSTGNTWLTFRNTRRTAGSAMGDGVTGVQLWRPGYPANGSATFTREFIEAMQKFQVIRTMDLVNANGNPSQTWAERTLPSFVGMTGDKGQSWELMVALANATGRDLWLTVPVKADDDYMRKLAQLVRYGSDGVEPYTSTQRNPKHAPLRSDLNVYVEYGNEVWNSGPDFKGFGWALELANRHRLDPTHPIANDGVVNDQYIALRRWIAYRSGLLSQTFRSVWGDNAMMSRVRPILASQVGNANLYLSLGLTWAEGFYGDVTRLWYGGGGAAYYDSTVAPVNLQASTMQGYFDGMPTANFARSVATDTVWAKGYGLRNIAYEGGPGPGGSALGSISSSAELAFAYNADPRMGERMLQAHDIWQANGGDLLVYYVYSSSAPWSFSDGSKPLVASDTTSTKLQFVDKLNGRPQAALTLGTQVPGTVYLRSPASAIQSRIGGDTTWKYGGTAYRINANAQYPAQAETVLVPISTNRAGRFVLAVNTLDALTTDRLDVFVNGKLAGDVRPGVPTAAAQPVASSPLTVSLPAGLSVVRVRAKVGSVWVRDLVVSAGN